MKRILVVATSQAQYENRNRPTGLWLAEFVHFYQQFPQDKFQIDVASPLGGKVPLDPISVKFTAMDVGVRKFYEDKSQMQLLENTLSSTQVLGNHYDAMYYTGGHGAMWDFPDEQNFQKIAKDIYESGGIVSALCHGVAGLLNIELSDGNYLVNNKNLTGYSDREEWLGGTKKIVPYSLEKELRKRGAKYSCSLIPFFPSVNVDGRLVTGQNFFSTKALAKKVFQMLTS